MCFRKQLHGGAAVAIPAGLSGIRCVQMRGRVGSAALVGIYTTQGFVGAVNSTFISYGRNTDFLCG